MFLTRIQVRLEKKWGFGFKMELIRKMNGTFLPPNYHKNFFLKVPNPKPKDQFYFLNSEVTKLLGSVAFIFPQPQAPKQLLIHLPGIHIDGQGDEVKSVGGVWRRRWPSVGYFAVAGAPGNFGLVYWLNTSLILSWM